MVLLPRAPAQQAIGPRFRASFPGQRGRLNAHPFAVQNETGLASMDQPAVLSKNPGVFRALAIGSNSFQSYAVPGSATQVHVVCSGQ